jgi:hypothetical protein
MVSQNPNAEKFGGSNLSVRLLTGLLFGFVLLLGGFLYVSVGLPLSNIDDFYFVGVATNLADKGLLENPHFCEAYHNGLGTNRFFYHPPFYPWLIAVWIRGFGLSSLSLQWLAFSLSAVGAASLFAVGRYFCVKRVELCALALVYFLCFARLGLRPEVAAYSFLFLGVYLLLVVKKWPFWALVAFALSVAFYPVTAIPAVCLVAYASFSLYSNENGYLWRVVVQGALATALLVLTFSFLIEHRILEFVKFYQTVASTQNPGIPFSWPRFIRYAELLSTDSQILPKLPFIISALLACAYCVLTKRISKAVATFLGVMLLCCVAAGGVAHLRAVEFTTLVAFVVLFFLVGAGEYRHSLRLLLLAGICIAAAIANSLILVTIAFQRPLPEQKRIDALQRVHTFHSLNYVVLVDSFVARHVFDWRVPSFCKDFCASRPLLWPRGSRVAPRSIIDLGRGEAVVISKAFTHTGWGHSGPRFAELLGRKVPTVTLYPCEPFFATGPPNPCIKRDDL